VYARDWSGIDGTVATVYIQAFMHSVVSMIQRLGFWGKAA